jgi:hypothetical protein
MTIREFTLWRPSIYETVPEMCLFGSESVSGVVEKRVGATVGVATGPTFVVLQDAPLHAAGISLVLVVRAARLMHLLCLSVLISLLISPL